MFKPICIVNILFISTKIPPLQKSKQHNSKPKNFRNQNCGTNGQGCTLVEANQNLHCQQPRLLPYHYPSTSISTSPIYFALKSFCYSFRKLVTTIIESNCLTVSDMPIHVFSTFLPCYLKFKHGCRIAREFRLFVRYTMLSVALKLVFSSDCSTDQLGMQSICFALLCTLVFLNILEGQFSTRFLYGSVPED